MAERDIGRVACIFKGDWDRSTTYDRMDLVRYGTSSFICTKSGAVGTAPNLDEDHWLPSAGNGLGVVDFILKDRKTPINTCHECYDLDIEALRGYKHEWDQERNEIRSSCERLDLVYVTWFEDGKKWIKWERNGDPTVPGWKMFAQQVAGYFDENDHYVTCRKSYEGCRYNRPDDSDRKTPIYYIGHEEGDDVVWTPETPGKGKEFRETGFLSYLDPEHADDKDHLIHDESKFDPRDWA